MFQIAELLLFPPFADYRIPSFSSGVTKSVTTSDTLTFIILDYGRLEIINITNEHLSHFEHSIKQTTTRYHLSWHHQRLIFFLIFV
jgi:hypothetical protein